MSRWMLIQADSREHDAEWERIKCQLDCEGVRYFRSKMFVGDYCDIDHARVCIDRKKNLQELAQNIAQDHTRFKDELLRAREYGFKLIILVEHSNAIKCIEDVYFWQNPRRKTSPKAVSGEQLYKSMCTIRDEYGVDFEFCSKLHTGRKIVEILRRWSAWVPVDG